MPHRISNHAFRLMTRKIREETGVSLKELQDDQRTAGATVTQRIMKCTTLLLYPTQNSAAMCIGDSHTSF